MITLLTIATLVTLAAPPWAGGPWTPPGHDKVTICKVDHDGEAETKHVPRHVAMKWLVKFPESYLGPCAEPTPEPTPEPT